MKLDYKGDDEVLEAFLLISIMHMLYSRRSSSEGGSTIRFSNPRHPWQRNLPPLLQYSLQSPRNLHLVQEQSTNNLRQKLRHQDVTAIQIRANGTPVPFERIEEYVGCISRDRV